MIDVKKEAKEWLDEFTDEYDEVDLKSLTALIDDLIKRAVYDDEHIKLSTDESKEYHMSGIPNDTLCVCGHTYYRHFDTYDNMAPVGCKYCSHYGDIYSKYNCPGFKKK